MEALTAAGFACKLHKQRDFRESHGFVSVLSEDGEELAERSVQHNRNYSEREDSSRHGSGCDRPPGQQRGRRASLRTSSL